MVLLGDRPTVTDIPEVIGAFYEAAYEPLLWPDALDVIARHFNARGAIMPGSTFVPGCLPHSRGMADVLQQFFGENWHLSDLRSIAAQTYNFTHEVVTDQHLFTLEDIGRSEYYKGFARAAGVPWFCAVALAGARGGDYVALSLQRTERQGLFDGDDQKRLQQLLPHLRNAVSLGRSVLHKRMSDLLEGLDHDRTPALLVQANGRLLCANTSFGRLSHAALRVVAGRLTAHDHAEQRALAYLLARVGGAELAADGFCGPLALRGGVEGPPLILRAAPFRATAGTTLRVEGVLVTMIDLAADIAPGEQILRDIYQLTQREAQIMALVGRGQTLDQIAWLLHVSKETIRFHLKAVLSKTGASRQSEVVAICHRIGLP